MRRGRAAGVGLAVVLLSCIGCADNSEVSGMVTFNGEPVETGNIAFIPVDGQSPTAGGEVKNGRYTARVPLGKMKVTISSPKVVGKKKLYNTPNSPEMPITDERLPAKYSQLEKSELEYEVKPGRNEKNFELTSP